MICVELIVIFVFARFTFFDIKLAQCIVIYC